MKTNFTIYTLLPLVLSLTVLSVRSQNSFQYNFNKTPALFDVIAVNKTVDLSWITALELGNGHFEIERSFDRSHFKTIAIVLDGFTLAGNNKNYRFRDKEMEIQDSPIIYYRITQMGLDGSIHSSIVLVVRPACNPDAITKTQLIKVSNS